MCIQVNLLVLPNQRISVLRPSENCSPMAPLWVFFSNDLGMFSLFKISYKSMSCDIWGQYVTFQLLRLIKHWRLVRCLWCVCHPASRWKRPSPNQNWQNWTAPRKHSATRILSISRKFLHLLDYTIVFNYCRTAMLAYGLETNHRSPTVIIFLLPVWATWECVCNVYDYCRLGVSKACFLFNPGLFLTVCCCAAF